MYRLILLIIISFVIPTSHATKRINTFGFYLVCNETTKNHTKKWLPIHKLLKTKYDKKICIDISSTFNLNELVTIRPMVNRRTIHEKYIREIFKKTMTINKSNQIDILLVLKEEDKRKFSSWTKKYIRRNVAVVLNDSVITAPRLTAAITTGKLSFSLNLDVKYATNLVNEIKKNVRIVKK